MAGKDFLASAHIINGAYPVADAFASALTSDYISCRDYRRIGFIVHTGVATSGTANGVITVKASTTTSGGTAMAFHYRTSASSTSVDTWSSMTAATSSGFVMTLGSNVLYYIEVDAAEVQDAVANADFAALIVTEDTDDPVVAGVIAIGLDPRYSGDVPLTAIA